MTNRLQVTTNDELETKMVGKKIGEMLEGGECIELRGDLGAGKTVFVKGLAIGIGSEDDVTSPSFALKNIYSGRLELQHFDLYRLDEPGLIVEEINEAIKQPKTVVAIEWAGQAHADIPKNRYTVDISPSNNNQRIIKIEIPQ